MVRKIKSLKTASMKRYGYVEITDDLTLPICTRGGVTLQDVMAEYEKTLKLPKMPLKPATPEQIKQLNEMGIQVTSHPVMVREFDYTSPQYLELIKQRNQIEVFVKIGIHIDLDYEVGNDEAQIPLWQDLGLSSNKDYIGVAKYIKDLDLRQVELTAIMQVIQHIAKSDYKTYEDFEIELKTLIEAQEKLNQQDS